MKEEKISFYVTILSVVITILALLRDFLGFEVGKTTNDRLTDLIIQLVVIIAVIFIGFYIGRKMFPVFSTFKEISETQINSDLKYNKYKGIVGILREHTNPELLHFIAFYDVDLKHYFYIQKEPTEKLLQRLPVGITFADQIKAYIEIGQKIYTFNKEINNKLKIFELNQGEIIHLVIDVTIGGIFYYDLEISGHKHYLIASTLHQEKVYDCDEQLNIVGTEIKNKHYGSKQKSLINAS